ncbi:MAG: hypothetical protein ACON35_07850 [Candidatus Marinamargulisbacteria bacterium]
MSVVIQGLPTHYLSPEKVFVGDKITYTIEVPAEVVIDLKAPTLNGLEILENSIDRRPTATVHQFSYQVFSIEPIIIPTVSINSINGLAPTTLKPIILSVQSLVSPTKNQLNDIAPILSLFFISWPLISFILIVLILLGVSLYSWRTKKRRQQIQASEIPEITPFEHFQKQMQQLEQTINSDDEVIRIAYFKLTEIFFTYFTNKTNINVIDATTVEMKRLLKLNKTMDQSLTKSLILIAEELDHFKFSKHPERSEASIKDMLKRIKKIAKGMEQ